MAAWQDIFLRIETQVKKCRLASELFSITSSLHNKSISTAILSNCKGNTILNNLYLYRAFYLSHLEIVLSTASNLTTYYTWVPLTLLWWICSHVSLDRKCDVRRTPVFPLTLFVCPVLFTALLSLTSDVLLIPVFTCPLWLNIGTILCHSRTLSWPSVW